MIINKEDKRNNEIKIKSNFCSWLSRNAKAECLDEINITDEMQIYPKVFEDIEEWAIWNLNEIFE